MIDDKAWQEYLEVLRALADAIDVAAESQKVVLRKLEPVRNFVADYKYRERFGRLPMHAAGDPQLYPPQGEPGGDPEPQTEKEAIEAEQNSHIHF